jgi:hypothetical protein
VADLTVGTHQIIAAYLGDPNFAGSESDALAQLVNRARTSVALTSLANPSVFGQPVQLTATVSVLAPGAGNPTGHITFTDGSTTLGVVEVGPSTAEQASLTTAALSVGPHAISVSYDGDGSFQGSTDALTQTVQRARTSTVVTSSVNPARSGQSIRFTAAISPVAPGAGNPTGTVAFTVNGAAIGSPVPLTGGSATSAAFTSLSPGNYDIRATYTGDPNFVGSAAALDQGTGLDVTPGATSMTLTSTPNPGAFGATVSFAATVTAVAPATGRPTGVVDLYDGTELLGAVSLVPGSAADMGTATFTSSTLDTGTHAIRAEYLGNYNFTGQSASLSQVVGLVPSTTGLTSAPNPSVYGTTVTLTSLVSADPASAGTPTGSVTFLDGSTVLGTATLTQVHGHAQASLEVPGLGGGSHPIQARYNGNGSFAASTSTTVTQVVQRAATAIDADPVILTQSQYEQFGAQLHLVIGQVRATLTSGGAPVAGQSVVFTSLDPYNPDVCTAVTDSNGVASCVATLDRVANIASSGGYHATFAGSADYLPARKVGVIAGP